MKKWAVLALLALSMFIIVIDTTIMNVSISALVNDLNTSVSGIQSAIALFALVMASTIMIGGKLGESIGKKRMFILGIAIFGVGTFTASISTNLGMLLIGWSVIEGIGSALMLPNIQTILRSSYEGKDRALAYGVIGAVGAVGAALGPLIGGFLTSYYSWRWAFRLEVAIVLIVLIFSGYISNDKIKKPKINLDFLSVFYWSFSLILIVLGLLMAQTYGLFSAKQAFVIGELSISPFGLSVVPFIFGISFILLILFDNRNSKLLKNGGNYLFNSSIFKFSGYTRSEIVRFLNMLVIASFIFIYPLFLQMSYDFSAIQTGVLLMPFSISLLIASLSGSKLISKFKPKSILIFGFVISTLGLFLILPVSEIYLSPVTLAGVSILIGLGFGFIASQLVNLVFSTVGEEYQSDAAGLNGTFEQLGNSVGIALIGSILVGVLTANLIIGISNNNLIPNDIKPEISERLESGVDILSDTSIREILSEVENEEIVESVVSDYRESRGEAFKLGIVALSFLSLGAALIATKMPEVELS